MDSHGTTPVCSPGQQAEIASRLVRAVPKAITFSGLDPKEVIKFTGRGEPLERALSRAFQMLYNGHADTAAPDWSIMPYNPYNWKVISQADNGSWRWDPSKVALWRDILRPKDNTVGSIIEALGDARVLNARVAELLALHEYEVPPEWEDNLVVFPGTIFERSDGARFIMAVYCGPREFGKKRSPVVIQLSQEWHPNWVIATLKQEE